MSSSFRFAGYVLALLAVIPIAGALVTGSVRGALAYSRVWCRCMAFVLVAAFAAGLLSGALSLLMRP